METYTEEQLNQMSADDRIAYYHRKRDFENNQKKQNMESLNADQLKALAATYAALRDSLQMIKDCNDLYLSQIDKLETAFYKLSSEFVLDEPVSNDHADA
jgi:hypothetical protein